MTGRRNGWLTGLTIGLIIGLGASLPLRRWTPAVAQDPTVFRGQSAALLERIARSVEEIQQTLRRIEQTLAKRPGGSPPSSVGTAGDAGAGRPAPPR
jgi:hypothetical protein